MNTSLFFSAVFVPIIFGTILHFAFAERSFIINYTENAFYMDGKPFQYVAGSVHYFRMSHEYWRDRLRKVKAAGLNAISTYTEWSLHEKIPGQYDFEGSLDVQKFIEIAQEEDLYVILRPGPYICAERDLGGLPYWLMSKYPEIKFRERDSNYERHVEKWMDVLLGNLSHLFYGRGGPIIMLQVENEYGSYNACDIQHLIWLRDLFKKHVKDDAVLFTTDGASRDLLKCGKIPGVYATVDFGPNSNVTKMFDEQRHIEPKGPLINSEYYPGWLTHWGDASLARRKTTDVIRTLKEMLDMKANVNFYMFYGGTNFGFTAGANMFKTYEADITSYDYDAPISEAGDLTPKYEAIKNVLFQYFGAQATKNVETSPKGDYGQLTLRRVATIFSPKIRKELGKFHSNLEPMCFEDLNQNAGYVLYETKAFFNSSISGIQDILEIKKIRDIAHVYVDGKYVGNLSREHSTSKLRINANGYKLSVMVENLGRINFGSQIKDKKGILSPVLLRKERLSSWNMTGFELLDLKAVEECNERKAEECDNDQGFVFYTTTFKLPYLNCTQKHKIPDSYLDVSYLSKGVVFINGFNLGRYWSWRGPQYTLYVPGVYLKPQPENNTIIILEENMKSHDIQVNFTTTPLFS